MYCSSCRSIVPRKPRQYIGTVPKDRRGQEHSWRLGEKPSYDGREISSFCILDWRVVRFIPSLAAAPAGPPMIHLAA